MSRILWLVYLSRAADDVVAEVGKVAERRMELSASVAALQEGSQNLMSARASSLASCATDVQWSQTLRALSE